MKKKAQIKFGETIGVIIIVYMILMVGLIWYNNYNTKSLNELRENDLKDRAFEKFNYIKNLNLIHLSEQGIIDTKFDKASLMAMANMSQNKTGKEYFSRQLGEATIIVEIYNSSNLNLTNYEEVILLYNSTPNANKTIINQETYKTLLPVFDPEDKSVKIGYMKLTNYITDY